LYRDWPLEFAALGFATVGDVLANPASYDGAALADPIEGTGYGRTTAKFFANVGGKPCIHSHAHGGCQYFLKPTTGPEPRREEPPFDPEYYEQYAPLGDEDGLPQSQPAPESPNGQGAVQADGGEESDVWHEPILFGSKAEMPEIKPEWLPGIFGEYADRLSQNLQTPPALAVMSVLSVLSAALARKVVIGPWCDDAYSEPINIWTLTVAESGERKSQILGRCTRPLVIWEKERTRLEKAELEQAASLRKVAERRADKLEADAAKEADPAQREALAKEAATLRDEQPEERHPTQVFTGDATPEAAQELLVKAGGRMAFISDESGLLQVMAGVYGGG
jgi:putative DNA primase/helicase